MSLKKKKKVDFELKFNEQFDKGYFIRVMCYQNFILFDIGQFFFRFKSQNDSHGIYGHL